MASSTSNSRNGDGGGISLTASQLSKAKEAIEILSSLTGDSDARSGNSSRSSTSQNQAASTSHNTRTIVSQRASPSTSRGTEDGETIIK